MKQLRPHLHESEYLSLIRNIETNGGRLIAAFDDEHCVGVALFRYQLRMHGGAMLYVDDLITDQQHRSKGVGKQLLEWITQEARRLGCTRLVLDSGVHRDQAHKFYFREGFIVSAFNFTKAL